MAARAAAKVAGGGKNGRTASLTNSIRVSRHAEHGESRKSGGCSTLAVAKSAKWLAESGGLGTCVTRGVTGVADAIGKILNI